ncbi:MAG: hypothetical protein M1609_05250, partial [Firmicutes bacterium]|nr:hypothetical protein [Bacillota bacterium]
FISNSINIPPPSHFVPLFWHSRLLPAAYVTDARHIDAYLSGKGYVEHRQGQDDIVILDRWAWVWGYFPGSIIFFPAPFFIAEHGQQSFYFLYYIILERKTDGAIRCTRIKQPSFVRAAEVPCIRDICSRKEAAVPKQRHKMAGRWNINRITDEDLQKQNVVMY